MKLIRSPYYLVPFYVFSSARGVFFDANDSKTFLRSKRNTCTSFNSDELEETCFTSKFCDFEEFAEKAENVYSSNTIGEKSWGRRKKILPNHDIYEKWYSECGDLNNCDCKERLKGYFDCTSQKTNSACKTDFWEKKTKIVTERTHLRNLFNGEIYQTEPSPITEKITTTITEKTTTNEPTTTTSPKTTVWQASQPNFENANRNDFTAGEKV